MLTKNTKIVCTLGPATESVEKITKLIKYGMNVARLNFSHGTHENHKLLINNIRKAEKETESTIGIMADLQGPKIRIKTEKKESTHIKKGEKIRIGSKTLFKTFEFYISHKEILNDIKVSQKILINDGILEGKIITKTKNYFEVQFTTQGEIKNGNAISFPDSTITIPEITKKDIEDLNFALKNKVDFIALSFVKSEKSIENLRLMISKKGLKTPIIAKIERHEAIENLENIIKSADAVMVARGDLGTDIPPEQVPIIQKKIISTSNRYGKAVITATQVLQSMIENPKATRAEISDAANAIFDHTDAIMLSNETAVGAYPENATKTLNEVAKAIEYELKKDGDLIEHTPNKHMSKLNASSLNACELAEDSHAKFIIVYTNDGYTAQQVSKHRTYIPIITITPNKQVKRILTLTWGINKVFIKKFPKNLNRKNEQILSFIKKNKIAKTGDKIVVLTNSSTNESTIYINQIK